MDFIRIWLLEEFLYEAMTGIVFYPRTLWRSIKIPRKMLQYAQREVGDAPDQQYTDLLSPVLFLMLTLALSHAVTQAVAPSSGELRGLMARLMGSEQNQLITRSVAFAIFPSVIHQQLRRTRTPLIWNSLRAPFHGQCFIAGVFALLLGLGVMFMTTGNAALIATGATLSTTALVWYIVCKHAGLTNTAARRSRPRWAWRTNGFLKASVIVVSAALVVSKGVVTPGINQARRQSRARATGTRSRWRRHLRCCRIRTTLPRRPECCERCQQASRCSARRIATSTFWVNRAVESRRRAASPPERLQPAPVADRPRHVRFGSRRVGSPPAARTMSDASARTRPDRRTSRAPGPRMGRRWRHQTRRTAATAPGVALVSGPGHQSEPETPPRAHARPAASVHG